MSKPRNTSKRINLEPFSQNSQNKYSSKGQTTPSVSLSITSQRGIKDPLSAFKDMSKREERKWLHQSQINLIFISSTSTTSLEENSSTSNLMQKYPKKSSNKLTKSIKFIEEQSSRDFPTTPHKQMPFKKQELYPKDILYSITMSQQSEKPIAKNIQKNKQNS